MTRTPGLTLLLVLLAGGGVGYWMWPSTAPTGGTPAAAARGGAAQRGSGDSVADIRLELLQRERVELGAPARNPFRFERRASAEPAPRTQATRRRAAVAPVDVEPAEPLPPPPPPPIPLRFIGYLQPRDTAGRVAVLSDGRGNVFNGKEGDVIEGRYRLLRVGNDSADLIYLDGRGRQTIRLSGQ
jgi:hypothetical protein